MLDLALRPRSALARLDDEPATVGADPPGVTLRETTPTALVAICARRAGADGLGQAFRAGLGFDLPAPLKSAEGDGIRAVWTAPGQWLAFGDAGLVQRLASSLGGAASLIELTGARTVIGVSGPRGRDALQKLLPIDLADAAFPIGAAASTIGAWLTVLVWRAGPDAYEATTYRSFGLALWKVIGHAAEEYGIGRG